MNRRKNKLTSTVAASLLALLVFTSCDDNFYLSEREVAAYSSVLATEEIANLHLDNLQGRTIELNFDNSSGTPRLSGSNLLSMMRSTELASLETGPGPVALSRLSSELEAQIGKWAEDRLDLYTSNSSDEKARLTELHTVRLTFLSDPVFDYRSDRQSIGYSIRTSVQFVGEVEVNAVNWLFDLFTNINGTYPLVITIPDLRLDGDAAIYSPYANAGRIRLKMIPQLAAPISVAGNGASVPGAVRDGISRVLSHLMTRPVDHMFDLGYYHFSIPDLRITRHSSVSPARLVVAYGHRADWLGPDDARPELHIVAPRTNGRLFHSIRRNGVWSDFREIEFGEKNKQTESEKAFDPVLIHSGAGQLEMVATDSQGNLLYSHWRDESWGNSSVIAPVKSGSRIVSPVGVPALAASAPGQAEIVVAGTDGELWHHRRVHGELVTPVTIPLKDYPGIEGPFRDPAAAIVGGKLIVAFVDSSDHISAVAFDLETGIWGQPTTLHSPGRIRSKVRFAPTLAACGADRVDLAFSNDAGLPIHNRLEIYGGNFQTGVGQSGISFSPPQKVGNFRTNAPPVLVCSSFGQPELVVRDTNNRIRHNLYFYSLGPHPIDGRTVNPGWQGWTVLTGGFRTAQPKYALEVGGFSAAGARSGKIEIAAISDPAGQAIQSRVFHNELESGRYGREPWKTVGWRGWELTDVMQYTGTPAIAAVDRNFQSVHIGNRSGFGQTPHTGRLAQTNATYPIGSTTAVRTSQHPVNPIVLSNGPGFYDDIVVRSDGVPVHSRHRLSGVSRPHALQVPAGIEIKAMSAVGYGSGSLMFAATGTNGSVFVWRFRGEDWSPAVEVGSGAASEPALVHLGAGEFDLFYIRGDGVLLRTRFENGIWISPKKVQADFQADERLFSDRSVASWGDGTVDLILVRRQDGRMFHRRFAANEGCPVPADCPKRVFSELVGTTKEDPILAAFGPVHLNVLAMRGLRWYSSEASRNPAQPADRIAPPDPVLSWTYAESIGGSEMIVGGLAHSGPMNVSAIATYGGDLFVIRKSNGIWTGFRPVAGQVPDTVVRMPVFLPDIASYSGE